MPNKYSRGSCGVLGSGRWCGVHDPQSRWVLSVLVRLLAGRRGGEDSRRSWGGTGPRHTSPPIFQTTLKTGVIIAIKRAAGQGRGFLIDTGGDPRTDPEPDLDPRLRLCCLPKEGVSSKRTALRTIPTSTSWEAILAAFCSTIMHFPGRLQDEFWARGSVGLGTGFATLWGGADVLYAR